MRRDRSFKSDYDGGAGIDRGCLRASFGAACMSNIVEAASPDQRKTFRRKVLKGGLIAFKHLNSSLTCTVRNLSSAGACLLTTQSAGVPDDFYLFIRSSAMRTRCHIAWRNGERLGVRFV